MADLIEWKNAIREGRQARSVQCSYREFIGDPEISRALVVANYATLGNPVRSNGTDLYFVCNSIQSSDISKSAIADKTICEDLKFEAATEKEFCIFMYGSTDDARAITVRVRGFRPFFDIYAADNNSTVDVRQRIMRHLDHRALSAVGGGDMRIEIMKAYLLSTGFMTEPERVARISFSNITSARTVLNAMIVANERVFNDSLGEHSYHRQFLVQTGLVCSQWLRACKFSYYDFDKIAANSKGNCLFIDVHWTNLSNPTGDRLHLYQDPSLNLVWDIETYGRGHTSVPLPEKDHDEMTLVCYNLYWYFRATKLLGIATTRRRIDIDEYNASHPDESGLIIVCEKEAQMIVVHGFIIRRFMPSFITGFNDIGYDWPWIMKRALRLNVDGAPASLASTLYTKMCYSECGYLRLESHRQNLQAYYERTVPFKIDAENTRDVNMIQTDGFLALDAMLLLMREYPKDEGAQGGWASSLNHFAQRILQAETKVDLSLASPDEAIRIQGDAHLEIHRIIEAYDGSGGTNFDRIGDLVYYCFRDVYITSEVFRVAGIISKYRPQCEQAHLGFPDCVYRAGTMKVLYAMAYGARVEFQRIHGAPLLINYTRPSHGANQAAKIEGAFVVYPVYGPESELPVAGHDIESLYPNIMRHYNLCVTRAVNIENLMGPDYVAMLQKVHANGGFKEFHEIQILDQGRRTTFWTLKHNGDERRMGITPIVLTGLLEDRVKLKQAAGRLKAFLTDLDRKARLREVLSEWALNPKINDPTVAAEVVSWCQNFLACDDEALPGAIAARLEFMQFRAEQVDNNQTAKKVLLNTFYGALGFSSFVLYNRNLGSAVTNLGQRIIKMLQQYARESGYILKYGDTDSMYVARPLSFYEDLIIHQRNELLSVREAINEGLIVDYEAERLRLRRDYYHAIISRAIADGKSFQVDLNRFLQSQHDGLSIIRIVYEEILFPSYFFDKKVYAGLIHKDAPALKMPEPGGESSWQRWFEKQLLIKGLAMVKQGASELVTQVTKDLLYEVLWPFSDHNMNGESTNALVERQVVAILDSPIWTNYDQLATSKRYKADKNNVVVNNFISRLRARGDPVIPKDGERFKIVYVRPEIARINVFGRVNQLQISDKIEYLHVAKQQHLTIDKQYYVNSQLGNTLTRMLKYQWFSPDANEETNKSEMKKQALKYLEAMLKRLLGGDDPVTVVQARQQIRQFIDTADIPLQRVLRSTFSEIVGGQYFKITADTPSVLADLPNAAAIAAITKLTLSQKTVESRMPEIMSMDATNVHQTLEAVLPATRKAYTDLSNIIIAARDSHTLSTVVIPGHLVETVLTYLDLLSQLHLCNAKNIISLANKSFALNGI